MSCLLWSRLAFVGIAARPAMAVEPWRQFLDGLRERGLDDMALVYLDRMGASPTCPAELKQVIDYEAGIMLMSGSRSLRVSSARAQSIGPCAPALEKFIAEHPTHALASSARTHLANVLVERGRMKVDQAGRPNALPRKRTNCWPTPEGSTKRPEPSSPRRRAFVEVLRPLEQGQIDPKDTKRLETRDQARRDLLEAKLFLATVVYEIALTHPAGSAPRKELLTDSAKRYNAIYQRYEKLGAGLYARMWEGRAYKDLGDAEKALQIFDEILARPDDPQIHDLRNKTLVLAMETLGQTEPKRYKNILERAQEWEKTARAPTNRARMG